MIQISEAEAAAAEKALKAAMTWAQWQRDHHAMRINRYGEQGGVEDALEPAELDLYLAIGEYERLGK